MRRYAIAALFLILAGCSIGVGDKDEQRSEAKMQGESFTGENPREELGSIKGTSDAEAIPALEDLGLAPELTNEIWINSAEPLRLAELRGKVVLLEMWTFG